MTEKHKKQVAIIGLGYVGTAYKKLFPNAVIYDPPKGFSDKDLVNECELAIVSVPTPMGDNGDCDISIVEEVLEWINTPLILIKSTVQPGTTEKLRQKTGKRICHSPEYVGEGGYYVPFWKYPHPTEPQHHSFMIIGGEPRDCDDILDFFQPVLGADKTYYQCSSTESEIIKYMENCAIGAKVILCNEFAKICDTFGASYNKVREGFILDERLGRMFTSVFVDKRGFGGKCLPKDINGIVSASTKAGYEPKFLKEILSTNERLKTNQT